MGGERPSTRIASLADDVTRLSLEVAGMEAVGTQAIRLLRATMIYIGPENGRLVADEWTRLMGNTKPTADGLYFAIKEFLEDY